MSRTPLMLRGCHLTLVMRARLSKGGHLRVDKVCEHPRLTRHTGRTSREDQTETRWHVDGWPVADLDEAVQRLGEPPRDPPEVPARLRRPGPVQGRLL